MSSKVVNIIALELGVLIAILAWLAFSNLRMVRPTSPPRAAETYTTVAPVSRSAEPQRAVVDYRAADFTPEQAEDVEPDQNYSNQAVVPQTYSNGGLNDGFVTESSPYYSNVTSEPLFDSPDCYFAQPYAFYPQSSVIVVYSNHRSFGRRPPPMARLTGNNMTGMPRRPVMRPTRPHTDAVVPPQNTHRQASRPSSNSTLRDRR